MFNIKSIKIAPDVGDNDAAGMSGGAAGGHTSKGGKAPNTGDAAEASVVIFGRDDGGKAHASRFGEADREDAIKAAHLMGFVALAVTQDAVRTIAGILPEGRLFESGKAFVPFVKSGHCIALEAHAKQFPRDVLALSPSVIAELKAEEAQKALRAEAELEAEQAADQTAKAADNKDGDDADGTATQDVDPASGEDLPANATLPKDWASFEVGSRVLAVDDPDDGWWEALVTDVHTSGIKGHMVTMLTLRWTLWPEEPAIVRRATDVALLHPKHGQSDASTSSDGEADAANPAEG